MRLAHTVGTHILEDPSPSRSGSSRMRLMGATPSSPSLRRKPLSPLISNALSPVEKTSLSLHHLGNGRGLASRFQAPSLSSSITPISLMPPPSRFLLMWLLPPSFSSRRVVLLGLAPSQSTCSPSILKELISKNSAKSMQSEVCHTLTSPPSTSSRLPLKPPFRIGLLIIFSLTFPCTPLTALSLRTLL